MVPIPDLRAVLLNTEVPPKVVIRREQQSGNAIHLSIVSSAAGAA